MDYLAEHRRILELAVSGRLPQQIDEKSDVAVAVFRELYEAGYVEPIDELLLDGDALANHALPCPVAAIWTGFNSAPSKRQPPAKLD